MAQPNLNSSLPKQLFCESCGQSHSAGAAFCQDCGQNLKRTTGAVEETSLALGDGGSLVVALEPLKQQLETLEQAGADHFALNQLRFMVAVAHLRKEETLEAIGLLRQIVADDDSQALAHAYLGAALLEEYAVEEAETELVRAEELAPADAIVQLKLGEYKLRMGLIPEAVAHLEAAQHLPAPSPETAVYIRNLLMSARQRHLKAIPRSNRLYNLNLAKFFGGLAKRSNQAGKVERLNPVSKVPTEIEIELG